MAVMWGFVGQNNASLVGHKQETFKAHGCKSW